MVLPSFEYFEPRSIKEACKLLKKYGDKARVIAGGTDLLVQMKTGEVRPKYIIGLKGIKGLDYINYSARKGLRIGPLAAIQALADSKIVREKFSLLAEAASKIGSTQVRNIGTVVGNICNAVSSGDMAPALLICEGKAIIAGVGGEKEVALEDFFVGNKKTVLAKGEMVKEIVVPPLAVNSGGVYIKQELRQAMDLALVGVAVLVVLDGKGICKDTRIALGAVAPSPMRAKKAEKVLRGKAIDAERTKEVAEVAMREAKPIGDIRAPAEYRRKVVGVLVRRGIEEAQRRAESAVK